MQCASGSAGAAPRDGDGDAGATRDGEEEEAVSRAAWRGESARGECGWGEAGASEGESVGEAGWRARGSEWSLAGAPRGPDVAGAAEVALEEEEGWTGVSAGGSRSCIQTVTSVAARTGSVRGDCGLSSSEVCVGERRCTCGMRSGNRYIEDHVYS